MYPLLDSIHSPSDLKQLDDEQLDLLAFEIRKRLVDVTSVTGGHLAASLGTVELILAIHRFLDCPRDKLFFDVGHQAYAHKLVTGRGDVFDTLRQFNGISGFTRREESEYDSHDSGHASDSLSTALGYAYARDLRGGDESVVAMIGDGSISGGLAFEALNCMGQRKTPITIVLNDNTMSISKNVGAISLELARARTSKLYKESSHRLRERLSNDGQLSKVLLETGLRARDSLKSWLLPGMLFEEMGIKYIGPIDGHNIAEITEALDAARRAAEPVIIHAVTRKGKGYRPAEERPDVFHGVAPFDRSTGEIITREGAVPSYTSIFSQQLISMADHDERIVAITAAMPAGTGLEAFGKRFPKRFFDVGIAEEHAVTMSSGLALGGRKPFVAIYSTFLQRAFDEIVINVAMQDLPVTFCIDRAGVVGADGTTHTGAFDIVYLRMLPNMTILAPSDEAELARALRTAQAATGPVAIRYPRGSARGVEIPDEPQPFEQAASRTLRVGDDVCLIAVGSMVADAERAADLLAADGISAEVIDARYVKPVDTAMVDRAASRFPLVVTLEEGAVAGGFGSAVLEHLNARGMQTPVLQLGLPDSFVTHGSPSQIKEMLGLDADGIASSVRKRLGGE